MSGKTILETRKGKDNIKMDPKDMGCEIMDWIHSFNLCEYSNERLVSIKGGGFFRRYSQKGLCSMQLANHSEVTRRAAYPNSSAID